MKNLYLGLTVLAGGKQLRARNFELVAFAVIP